MLKRDINPFVMSDEWQAPFVRRKKNDRFDSYFSGNGYYPNDGKYNTDIRLNLQVFCDAEGRISSMSYYKVHDLTMGHGKPVTRNASLSRSDKAAFAKALEDSTTSTAGTELEQLLVHAAGKKLLGGWKISQFDKRSVKFCNSYKVEVIIPCSRICKAIDISHNYLEILKYKEFWEANRDCLHLEDADPLLALFSLIDPSQYYEYEVLRVETEKRVLKSEISARLEIIKEATKEGNVREIHKQLKLIPQDVIKGKDLSEALCIAIKEKNEPLARMLVKNGADVNINHTVGGYTEGPLFYALENGWDSFFSYCLKKYFVPETYGNSSLIYKTVDMKRFDLVMMLLKAGCSTMIFKESLVKWGTDNINKALSIPGVKIQWIPETLQTLKEIGEYTLIKKILSHLSNQLEHLRGDIVRWLLNTGDINLMKLYMKQAYLPLTKDSGFKIYNTINPVCYTNAWKQFYTEKLFGDEYVWNEFIKGSFHLALKQGNTESICFLLEEYPKAFNDEQIDEITLKINDPTMMPLVNKFITQIHFVDDGEWHGVSSYTPEEVHYYKVKHSGIRKLVAAALKYGDATTLDIIEDNQKDLFEEPYAFQDFYEALKQRKAGHEDAVYRRAMALLKPGAIKANRIHMWNNKLMSDNDLLRLKKATKEYLDELELANIN